MRYLIMLIALVSIVINGMTSYHLFQASSYDLSNLLVIAAYLSIVAGIYVATTHKQTTTLRK
jgi:hypothetical protein